MHINHANCRCLAYNVTTHNYSFKLYKSIVSVQRFHVEYVLYMVGNLLGIMCYESWVHHRQYCRAARRQGLWANRQTSNSIVSHKFIYFILQFQIFANFTNWFSIAIWAKMFAHDVTVELALSWKISAELLCWKMQKCEPAKLNVTTVLDACTQSTRTLIQQQ